MTDVQSKLSFCREHFSSHLNNNENATPGDDEPNRNEDGISNKIENKKAAVGVDLPTELLKYGDEELTIFHQRFIRSIRK